MSKQQYWFVILLCISSFAFMVSRGHGFVDLAAPLILVVQSVYDKDKRPIYTLKRIGEDKSAISTFSVSENASLYQGFFRVLASSDKKYVALRFSQSLTSNNSTAVDVVAINDNKIHNLFVTSVKTKRTVLLLDTGVVEEMAWEPNRPLLAILEKSGDKSKFTFYDAKNQSYTGFWLESPIVDWHWYPGESAAIVFFEKGKDYLQLQSPSGKVLKAKWMIPEKEPTILFVRPSPNGHFLLLQTENHVYVRAIFPVNRNQSINTQWHKLLSSEYDLSSDTINWSPNSELIGYKRTLYPNSVPPSAYPPEGFHEFVVISPQHPEKKRILFTWRDDDSFLHERFLGWMKDSQGIYALEPTAKRMLNVIEYRLTGRRRVLYTMPYDDIKVVSISP